MLVINFSLNYKNALTRLLALRLIYFSFTRVLFDVFISITSRNGLLEELCNFYDQGPLEVFVEVDKIIRIILSRDGLQVPYIHEVLS